MSGGHFDYQQYKISDICEQIEEYVYGKPLFDFTEETEYIEDHFLSDEEIAYVKEHHTTIPNVSELSKETIKEFKRAIKYLKKSAVYAQRIDWLLSGDDSEESFHKRLKEDLNNMRNDYRR